MAVKVGINGFGRIGRNLFRAAHESDADLDIVAVNDITDNATLAHLLKYDSILGRFPGEVTEGGGSITVDGKEIKVFEERDPADLPWGDIGVDVVIESTGLFTKREDAKKHLDAGAKKVIISAPATEPDVTVALGVNFDSEYDADSHHIISNASCTTNCLAPIAKVHQRCRRHRARADDDDSRLHGRPAPTGHAALRPAARACGGAQPDPDHDGRRQGGRPGASRARRPPERLRHARAGRDGLGRRPGRQRLARRPRRRRSTPPSRRRRRVPLKGILSYTEDAIVSTDIVKDPHSSIFDAGLTMVMEGTMVKAVSWYDNEWGYSNRVVELADEGPSGSARLCPRASAASARRRPRASASSCART